MNANRLVRRIHIWVGILIAPSVLFFAITGGLQLYRLHEDHDGYTASPVLAALGALHKDQVLGYPPRSAPPPPPPGAAARHDDDHDAPPKAATTMLKGVFLGVTVGLVITTLLGLWMALQDRLRRRTNLVLFAIGLVMPIALVLGLQ
jgi:hypothetical protein